MFGKFAIGITTAIIFVATIERSSGAAAAFSDDGNHVYLLGSKLPKGTVLLVDLTNFTTTKLNLGVSTEVQGIANAPRALLFVTEKSLYRLPLPMVKWAKSAMRQLESLTSKTWPAIGRNMEFCCCAMALARITRLARLLFARAGTKTDVAGAAARQRTSWRCLRPRRPSFLRVRR